MNIEDVRHEVCRVQRWRGHWPLQDPEGLGNEHTEGLDHHSTRHWAALVRWLVLT